MQILFGITKSNFGGAQRYVFDVAQNMAISGHSVSVVCGGDGVLVKKLQAVGIKTHVLPSLGRDMSIKNDFKALKDLIKILRETRPDVFHINSSKMGGIGALAGRLSRIKKIVFTAHGFAFNETRSEMSRKVIKFFSWLTIFLSHKTICVSDKLKSDVTSFPLVQNKLIVIKNGVEVFPTLDKLSAREKLSLEMPENSILVGTLSELHYTKGLDVMLRALNKTEERIHFAIFGTGELRVELRDLTKMLGLQNRVHFLGFVENANQYLKSLDIFTLTSRTEGLPYALLEAGVANLPVIATRVGGIPEIIKDGETGLLVESENSKVLAQTLTSLANNSKKREILGKNLHKLVIEEFSKEQMVEATSKLYL